MAGAELTLSLDNYNKPSVKEDADADSLRIMRALLRKVDNPIGGNIVFDISQYRFQDIDMLQSTLANDISTHLNRVLPMLVIDNVDVMKVSDNELMINIEISGTTERSKKRYLFNFQQDKNKNVNLKQIL